MSRKKTKTPQEPEAPKKPERAPGTYRADTLENFLDDVLDHDLFAGDGPLPVRREPGRSNLILVTGENATGKSMLRKVMSGALHKNKVEAIALSMQGRTSVGTFASFIYGDESSRATGCNTSNTISTAMSTSRGRDGRHAIIWDEPDVGLSDNYAVGAAHEILEFMRSPPEKLFYALVTTHRKAMLEALMAGEPHHLRLGDTLTLREFLVSPIAPKRLDELRERDVELFRRIHREFGV